MLLSLKGLLLINAVAQQSRPQPRDTDLTPGTSGRSYLALRPFCLAMGAAKMLMRTKPFAAAAA